jgi:hypothetical protein
MKTQNRFAVALTIVLSLAAGTLLLWQRPPLPNDHSLTRSDFTKPLVEPLVEHLVSSEKINPPAEIAADERVSRGDPPMPAGISRRCKNGFTIDRNIAGKFQGYSCNPSAYEDYDTEALESLAYGDAEAASVLAYRLRHTDYPRAIRLSLRSAALSGGKTSTLMSAAMWRPVEDENGNPSLSGYGQAYVLYQLIGKLKGNNYGGPPIYVKRIEELADDPQAVFEQLDSIANRMFEEVRQIELDVTGSSTIGGDDDV